MSDTKHVTLTIDGMHCGGCVRRVTAAVGAVDGVVAPTVEVGRATFGVEDGDDGVVDEVKAAIAVLGFAVTAASEA